MEYKSVKKRALICLASLAAILSTTASQASETISLKKSPGLQKPGKKHKQIENQPVVQATGLLGKLDLFRGVLVSDEPLKPMLATGALGESQRSEMPAKPAFGGIGFALHDSLSLVYKKGRLSSQSLNSENQGLYLLNSHKGIANWYVGMESSAWGSQADNRRVSTTTQIGVVLNLD